MPIRRQAPAGRHIQIGWARIAMPGMPFNQTFSFPHELTLRRTDEGIRMFAEPVAEIEKLYAREESLADRQLSEGQTVDIAVSRELLDIEAAFDVGAAETVGLEIVGERIVYDVRNRQLRGAELAPVDGRVTIRVLVDRPMLEIIGNDGRVFITNPRKRRGEVPAVQAFATGGRGWSGWTCGSWNRSGARRSNRMGADALRDSRVGMQHDPP